MSSARVKRRLDEERKNFLDNDYFEHYHNQVKLTQADEKPKKQMASAKSREQRDAGININLAFWTDPNGPFKFSLGFERPGILSAPAVNIPERRMKR